MPHLNSGGGSSKSKCQWGENAFGWIKINKSAAVFAAMPIWPGANVTSQCSNNNNRVSGQELCCFCHVPASASATSSSSAASRQSKGSFVSRPPSLLRHICATRTQAVSSANLSRPPRSNFKRALVIREAIRPVFCF